MSYTHIKHGEEMEVYSHIYYGGDKERVRKLVELPIDELDRLEQASIEKEEAIYLSTRELMAQWDTQAKETRGIRDAKAYLRTMPVSHTSNRAVKVANDFMEISNMVYKLTWRVYDRTSWNKAAGRQIVNAHELTWRLLYNTVREADNTSSGLQIAGQDRKVFRDKESLEKYLNGRIKAYAHLFQEISPPIPKGEEGRFSVNGVLLPNYTVEITADDLLQFIDEEDTPQEKQSHVPTKKPTVEPKKKRGMER